MQPVELIRLALRSLRRQRARTLLTTLGVAVGACSLASSVSLGVGLRALINREFRERPGFWEVQVHTGHFPPPIPESDIPADKVKVEGEFDAARMHRIRRQLVERYQRDHTTQPLAKLTDDTIAAIAAMPDVDEVVTARFEQGQSYWRGKEAFVNVVSGRCDQPQLRERIIAGRAPNMTDAECVVSEMLLYELGVRNEAQMQAAIGTTIDVQFGYRRETLADMLAKLQITDVEKQTLAALIARSQAETKPEHKPVSGTFVIVGIVRAPVPSDDKKRGSFRYQWTTLHTGGPASEAIFRQMPEYKDGHYPFAEVKVRPGGELKTIVDSIEAKGFETDSAAEWFTAAKHEVTIIAAGLNVFSLVALMVAALGITNTLVTSVVERTREIGILKAVGATRSQVRRLFLVEGTIIGFAGGVLGLILARLIAGPADEFVKSQVQTVMKGRTMMTESIYTFPIWLTLATPLFATLVTTLAALYPAHRAAKIAPIEALRYG